MEQHGLLRFITVVLVLGATVVQLSTAATCYFCTDDPNDADDWPTYDADCGKFDYMGNTDSLSFGGCSIRIYDSGYIDRWATIGNEDGECIYETDSTACYCTGEYCNTDSFCADCGYPKPTPTTEGTTMTTTSSSTAAPVTLKCYQCINCGHVDNDTPVIEGEYLSCVTTTVLESAEVIRGGSSKEHPDGECSQNTATLSCWCSEDLCNDITIEF
ncbi:unnamed protein product [Meganyctiphanes norvegica]|uniref:Uncharacterized protein n=1 Tax=Meganyctiphanes norvegica TaxID=48144 RepID=A0AAV2PPH8_MEGNR